MRWHLAIGGTAATARPLALLDESDVCDRVLAILQAIAAIGHEGRARDLSATFLPADATAATHQQSRRGDSALIGILALADDTHAVGIALPFGSMPAERIAQLCLEAHARGADEIRPAPRRTLLFRIPGEQDCFDLQQAAHGLGFVTETGDPRLHIAACPGEPACASGRIATREIAETVASSHAGLLDGSFTLHVSGCAKGCAHPATAALTLVGGENGAGLVVDGTAKALPPRYSPRYEAARGIGRVAALAGSARRGNETAATCLARLGEAAITDAFARLGTD
ncbi:hypothetical protein ACHMW4_03470 [Mesorhizobium sp. UC22_110]